MAAGAFLSGLGVRQEEVNGTLDWFPDGRLEVDVGARALGTARVEGTVTLTTVLDPGFDLDIRFDGFQAIDRRDATGRLSGAIYLAGSYSRPLISGDLFVDEGTLFVEEFQRAADVSDLFFERTAGVVDLTSVDSTAVRFQPFIGGQNPFLQNIRHGKHDLDGPAQHVDPQRGHGRGAGWRTRPSVRPGRLRIWPSSALWRRYADRTHWASDTSGDSFRWMGDRAVLGTPGFNPDLDLTASNDIRTPEGDRFTITAGVTGTLLSPRVALSSEEPGFTEDDL